MESLKIIGIIKKSFFDFIAYAFPLVYSGEKVFLESLKIIGIIKKSFFDFINKPNNSLL